MLPIVLFLTDGLPTIGQTSETAIRDLAIKGNLYARRVFTFGVGLDVNVPLLERIAEETRGTATFVLPREDVEVKVAAVFKRLAGPILADPRLTIVTPCGQPDPGRVCDVMPTRIRDLFVGDQLIVTGQYVGQEPISMQLTGNYLGTSRTFRFQFFLNWASTQNAFVPRLWASRKIAYLIDAIRQQGANNDPLYPVPPATSDPKTKELIDEVVRLSTEFGILTEYTAFLAREGTDLSARGSVLSEAGRNIVDRAVSTRSGLGAINQGENLTAMKGQTQVNIRNEFYDQQMRRVAEFNVQQVNDRAFYRKGDRWIDSRVISLNPNHISRIIEFGSHEYRALTERLAHEGRQGTLSLQGDILTVVDGESVLVRAPSGSMEP